MYTYIYNERYIGCDRAGFPDRPDMILDFILFFICFQATVSQGPPTCTKCSALLVSGAKFCTRCGTPVCNYY